VLRLRQGYGACTLLGVVLSHFGVTRMVFTQDEMLWFAFKMYLWLIDKHRDGVLNYDTKENILLVLAIQFLFIW
jgi:hypothetical protein